MGEQTAQKPKMNLATFLERESLVMFGLGFAAGMPNQLASAALAIWLREAGASLALIGLLGLATLTYALKFLWAPVVDRVAIPGLDKTMGRRRSWMLATQLVVMGALVAMALTNPAASFTATGDATKAFIPFAIFTVIVAFAGSTQDVAIDAWRIEVAKDGNRLGILTATYQWGYRIAMLLSGAAPLFIAQAFNGDTYAFKGWSVAYLVMASTMLLAIWATFMAPREHALAAPRWAAPVDVPRRGVIDGVEWLARFGLMVLAAMILAVGLAGKAEPLAWLVGGAYGGTEAMSDALAAKPWGVWQQVAYALVGLCVMVGACMPIGSIKSIPASYFQSALITPMANFFSRYQNVAATILVFLCVYRISDFVLNLASTMYIDAGFSKDAIAITQKFFGAAVSAFGAGFAGWAILRWGMFRCLVIGAFLQPLSNLAFVVITMFGAKLPLLYLAIGIDNFSGLFAGTCLIMYMSLLTKEGFTATQYAVFSSLYALPGKIITALSGRIVEGAAKAAESGWLAFARGWFSHLPQDAFVAAGAKLAVTNTAMAAGYGAFFIYTSLMGVFGVILAVIVANGPARAALEADSDKV